MATIARLHGIEILDSRGRPTLQATCLLADGASGAVSVPSGSSTGSAEAHELRDGDKRRYRGLGCLRAVANLNGEVQAALVGQDFPSQAALDEALCRLDGTPNKARLGGNTLLAASLAFARASANAQGIPLFAYFASLLNRRAASLPMPTINLFSGGKHAGAQVPIQDLLIVPISAQSISQALAITFDVYYAAVDLIGERYGQRHLKADEGGLAPPFPNLDAMFSDALTAIERAGYRPGVDVALAVDVASTHFYAAGRYALPDGDLTAAEMISQLATWAQRYPLISFEDGLAEDDWAHWPALRAALPNVMVLGDDLLCTNPTRIQRAIEARAANALLLKVNQIGTLSEAAAAFRLAKSDGWRVVVSARSGETEDHWLADLAVGWGGDQIKIGSINQSERLAKYNRLLTIEVEHGFPL